jgi:hypothetical protein
MIVRQAIKIKLKPLALQKWDFPMLVFWLAMYGYCLIALGALGLITELPWFFIIGLIFTFGTLLIGISEVKTNK